MSRGKSGPICRGCGAANAPGAPECWLCHRRDWRLDGARGVPSEVPRMIDRRPSPEPICRSCGAPNTPGSSECWLCQRRDWNRSSALRTRMTPPSDLPSRGPLGTIGGWMVVIALIGVALAILVLVPPLFVVLLAAALPALFVTEFKTNRRRRRDEWVSGWQRLRWFVGYTVLIPVFTMALGICLFSICMAFMR